MSLVTDLPARPAIRTKHRMRVFFTSLKTTET